MKDLDKIKAQDAHELNYHLPDEQVAIHPLAERDLSKLLVWNNGQIKDTAFKSLADYIPENSLLVFNNTKVIRARLHFQKATGAHIEIFCLDPESPSDYQLAFQQRESTVWNCMVGNLKKWKGEKLCLFIHIDGEEVAFYAEKLDRNDTAVQVRFSWENENYDFATLIEAAGELPIPPYLHRETEESDVERYQTVYSKEKGSVAAPTAGLHFTDDTFKKLSAKHISTAEVTLHVGAGTFKPVQSDKIGDHEMHAEQIIVNKSFVQQLMQKKGLLIAVGTTSIRSLESLYWLGVKMYANPDLAQSDFDIPQWMPYEDELNLSAAQSLQAILGYMETHHVEQLAFHTQIIIVPSYEFMFVQGMITNFHQPQSTLLLLISAFIGDDWKRVYAHAVENNYRFLSYGDSNLYLKK
ncbi:MAG: S-adenosylmethionine:tRNA ribosyltransferase-isomerase [Mangrovibacterium sp.]